MTNQNTQNKRVEDFQEDKETIAVSASPNSTPAPSTSSVVVTESDLNWAKAEMSNPHYGQHIAKQARLAIR